MEREEAAGGSSRGAAGTDLSVELGPLHLRNPVMNASGTCGYGDEWPALTQIAALGAIVCKTLTRDPRPGNPPPRLHETPGGLLNSIGLENIGAVQFLREHLPRLRSLGPRLILSVGGDAPEEYAACVRVLEDGSPDAYEVNVSCPNVAYGGLAFGRSAAASAEVVRAVRRVTERPLFVKLTPQVEEITVIGRACLDAGADGLTAVNTFLGMAVNVEQRRMVFARGVAGLSGPAIRPLALQRVWDLARCLNCPLIGVGGILTARDALEFLLVGASAVQIGSGLLRDPARAARVVQGMDEIAHRQGIGRIRDLIGQLRGAAPSPDHPAAPADGS